MLVIRLSSNIGDMVALRTKALDNEKKRADALLYQMLPKTVAENLKRGEVVNAEVGVL